jgi:hypothetical protein
MRTMLLLPLALAAAAAGCGTSSEGTEQAAFSVPRRDLTLREAVAPAVEVVSPVELARSQRPTAHRPQLARRPAQASRSRAADAGAAPVAPGALTLTDAKRAPPATDAAAGPADPHALAPGQTVTVIPASSGTSTPRDWTDQRPSDQGRGVTVGTGRHGGGCEPRGGMPGGGRGGGFRGLQ